MNLCAKLFALTAGLCGLAAAADPEMMGLVPPDASLILGVDVARIVASPIGAAIGEAMKQGISKQQSVEFAKTKPQFQEQIQLFGNIDLSHEVREVLIAGGYGKSAPMLMIVRSSLDPARIRALQAFAGDAVEYEGVPILASSKPGNGVIAFLDNGIVLIGQMRDVKSAIGRRRQPTALPAALAALVTKYGKYDLWSVSTETFAAPAHDLAAGSPIEATAAQYLARVAGVNGGVRLSPDFELSVDVEARTAKAATELAEGLGWVTSAVKAEAQKTGKGGTGLENLKTRVDGKHILVSLQVPEEQILAGLRQMRAQQQGKPAQPVAARLAPPAAPARGVPPPPPGTIRVQSSDMGTVVIPVEKEK